MLLKLAPWHPRYCIFCGEKLHYGNMNFGYWHGCKKLKKVWFMESANFNLFSVTKELIQIKDWEKKKNMLTILVKDFD